MLDLLKSILKESILIKRNNCDCWSFLSTFSIGAKMLLFLLLVFSSLLCYYNFYWKRSKYPPGTRFLEILHSLPWVFRPYTTSLFWQHSFRHKTWTWVWNFLKMERNIWTDIHILVRRKPRGYGIRLWKHRRIVRKRRRNLYRKTENSPMDEPC